MSVQAPSWLPLELSMDNKPIDQILASLYSVFQMDIKTGNLYFDTTPVGFYPEYEPNERGYEKIFWHLITKMDETTNERLIDYPRAKRLPWVKPMIENYRSPLIKAFDYQESNAKKGIRTYIWLETYDFLIVMKRVFLKNTRKEVMNIITSFNLESDSYRKSTLKKWEKRVRAYA